MRIFAKKNDYPMKKGIVQEIIMALQSGANPERAAKSTGYLKTFDEVQNTKKS